MGLDILMCSDRRWLDACLWLAWHNHLLWYSVKWMLLSGRLCDHHVVWRSRSWSCRLWWRSTNWLLRLLCWHKCHHTLRKRHRTWSEIHLHFPNTYQIIIHFKRLHRALYSYNRTIHSDILQTLKKNTKTVYGYARSGMLFVILVETMLQQQLYTGGL